MPVILGGNGIYLASLAPPVDPDAQAFLTAAAITDPTITSAINTLVVDMKGYGIWTKMKAIYPFVGGTATTHKWNLKDPRDLDAAFRLVFNGGWTHSSTGATPNGTNAYADTKCLLTNLSATSGHFSLYSRTNAQGPGFSINGIRDGAARGIQLVLRRFNDNKRYIALYSENANSFAGFSDETNSQGFYIGSRIANNNLSAYKNGVSFGNNTGISTDILIAANIFISAANKNPGIDYYDNKQLAFSSIGDGLTSTEAANLYTAVQNMQITLSRQV